MNAGFALLPWVVSEELLWQLAVLLLILGLAMTLIGLRGIGRVLIVSALCIVIIPVLLSPLVEDIIARLPVWLVMVVAVALVSYLVRLVLAFFLGRETVGQLVAYGIRAAVRQVLLVPVLLVKGGRGLVFLLQSSHVWQRALGWVLALLVIGLAGTAGYQFDKWPQPVQNTVEQWSPVEQAKPVDDERTRGNEGVQVGSDLL